MMSTDDAHLTNDDLRYERTRMKAALADATARADAAEKDQHALRSRMIDAERRVAELSRLFDDVGHALNASIADLDKAVARAEAAERTLADTLEALCAEMRIDLDGGADWVLGELHDRLKSDAEKIRSANAIESLLRHDRTGLIEVNAELRPWYAAARECAEAMGVTTPEELIKGAKALSLDQHPPVTIGGDDVTLQWIGSPLLPASKPHRVAQAGGHDLGVLVGYTDPNGLFRVTEGAKKGAVYGCLYRAEPIDRPVLGEPTPDLDVWVRTCIDEVTATHIYTGDGGRFRRSEWGPDRFAPVAKSTTSSAAPGEDDIPF
jgi:hypothetical protein